MDLWATYGGVAVESVWLMFTHQMLPPPDTPSPALLSAFKAAAGSGDFQPPRASAEQHMAGWFVRFGKTTLQGESAAVHLANASASALPLASITPTMALWSAGFAFATEIAAQHSSVKPGKQAPAVVVLGIASHKTRSAGRAALCTVNVLWDFVIGLLVVQVRATECRSLRTLQTDIAS